MSVLPFYAWWVCNLSFRKRAVDRRSGTVAGIRRFSAMGFFRDPLILLLLAAAAAIAFFVVATTPA
jgi:predicted aminopeptidase